MFIMERCRKCRLRHGKLGARRPVDNKRTQGKTCSMHGCENDRAKSKRYCSTCHAQYMRGHRPKHSELPAEARRRASARAMLHVYVSRGKVKRLPCEVCGALKVHGHHHDYSKPLDVRWLCKDHHHEEHARIKAQFSS